MHPRDQITMIIDKIYRSGLTTTSGGNVSIIVESGDIWVTPSAIDKGSLRPSDIVVVRKDGTIEGRHKPSSEYPFHRAIYESRPDIKAIVHAHPPTLVSFSIVRQIPDTNIIPQAKYVCGDIGYASYELPGSEELGGQITEEFIKGFNAVIMENHGTVVGGTDLRDAFQRFETLEFCGRTIIYGNMIGTPHCLTDEQIEEFENQIPRLLPEKDTPAVIINNDSVLVTGDKLLGTFDRLEVAEFNAKSLTIGTSLGSLFPINDKQVESLRKKFLG